MKFPAYPEYKDSGIKSLGMVPSHWVVIPAKYKIRTLSGGQTTKNKVSDEYAEGLYPAFSASGQDVWMEDYEFNAEGVVLSAVGARCGKTFKANGKWGVVANTHCLFPAKDVSRDYLWWLTNNEDWWEKGGTAQPFVKVSDSLARKIAFPNLQEQIVISHFLDHETKKIDELIYEQEQLIELLKEKRQSIISNAVCRGLDPNVPMKDSGVAWLGMIPEHWQLTRLGRVTSAINDINHEMPESVAEGIPFLSAKDLDDYGNLNFDNDVKLISEADYQRLSQKICPEKGDIIYSRYGTIGRAAIVKTDRKFLVSYSCCVIKIRRDDIALDYLRDLLSSDLILTESRTRIRSMGQPDLGLAEIRRFPITLPPIKEQIAIDKFLKNEITEIDALMREALKASQLLQERRSALISAVVCGQIDVRNFHGN